MGEDRVKVIGQHSSKLGVVHRLKAYLRFRLRSVNRHGVHSPFVFDLLEKGLRVRRGMPLLARLKSYFGGDAVQIVDVMALPALLDNHPATSTILYVPDVHQSDESFQEWMLATGHSAVRMSIEFWDGGLLFFRKDFLVPQHFVLRY